MIETLKSMRFWKYVVAFFVPLFVVVMLNTGMDNDIWGVIANGRWISENGLYYTDVLSMHEGLNVTVQNWLFAFFINGIFSVFGVAGIFVWMLLMNCLILFFLYKICMLLSKRNENLSLVLMVVTDVLLALGYIVTREQLFSYVVILAMIYVMELFIKGGKTKLLSFIPLMGLLMINMRASTWVLMLFIILIYIIDGIKQPKLHLQGYKIKPLIITMIFTFLVGFINPYGVKMMGFLTTSYSTRFFDFVNELSPFNPLLASGPAFWLGIMCVLIAYIFGNKKNIRVRYLCLFFMFFSMGLVAVKEIAELVLIMFFPLALLYRDWKKPRLIWSDVVRGAFILWTGIFAVVLVVVAVIARIVMINDRPGSLATAVDVIDERVTGEKRDLRIYTGYNDGGYLEYRGYRPYLDPRGEVFLMSNNGKEDILDEYLDLEEGEVAVQDFLDKYDFDYLVVEESEKLHDLEDEKYELIYDEGLQVYQKRVFDE